MFKKVMGLIDKLKSKEAAQKAASFSKSTSKKKNLPALLKKPQYTSHRNPQLHHISQKPKTI